MLTIAKKIRRCMILLTLLLFIVVEIPIIATGHLSEPEPGDVIIVLGAKLIGTEPSTMLRLRLNEAQRLYHAGYAPFIIVSGAKGPDEEISEAAAMRDYLIRTGVAADHILVEENSFNTYQNLVNSYAIMKQAGLTKAIIVSNSSHIRRSLVLAHNIGMNASGAPAPMADNTYLTAKQYIREGVAMLSLAFKN